MQPGERVAGRFRMERRAGSGGMGEVWRAIDEAQGVPVAVKLLVDLGGDAASRFLREARVLGELRHPAIVRYVAHGAEDDGTPWLAIEWLDGVDLATRLEAGPLGVQECVVLARRVAGALAAAHERGIVHRDVKPSNVFLPAGRSADAMLVDFGVARVLSASRVMTRAGVAIGTPGYMAPEQARGSKDVDARADVFALGCILFECIAGAPVFTAENLMGLLAKVLFEEVPRVASLQPGVPPGLDDLVARLVSKAPEGRPRDGAEVVRALDALDLRAAAGRAQRRASAPPRKAALTGRERRIVSVLAVGTPARQSAGGPADAVESVTPFDATLIEPAPLGPGHLALVRPVLAPIGGSLECLADGSLLWALEAQGTATDQAQRAALAALAVRAVLAAEPMAVATGWAEPGGSVPVGEAIDRVVALVRAGTVRAPAIALDEVTANLVRSHLDLRREGSAIALVGLRVDDPSGSTLLGRSTPFVGRERDLAALEGLVGECAEEGEACSILIVAPPGAGKSRLRRALSARLREERPDLQVLLAAPGGLDEAAPYGIAGGLLRRAARLAAGAAPSPLAQRLALRLDDARDAEWTARVLAEVAGEHAASTTDPRLVAARADPRLWGDHVLRAVLAWLGAELRRGPLLLVLEDLHAADRASVELVGTALSRFVDRPLCVLGVGRPELRGRFPELWRGRRPTVLEISALSRRAARDFVRQVLGESVTGEVADRLVSQSEGSPFALEELVRAHAEGRAEVPATLIAMVQSRLDGLDAHLRRTLRAASVLGQTAPLAAIGVLVGDDVPATDVRGAVDELVRRDLLTWEATSQSGEDEVCFRVAAVREAAYASLTEGDRALGHRLAGEWLESGGRADSEAAADHYLRAGEPARAVRGLADGAARALAASDLDRALALADRAVDAGATGEDLGLVLLRRAQALGWRGDVRLALPIAARAVALLPEWSEPWCWAVAQRHIDLVRSGDADSAADLARGILDAVGDEGPSEPVRAMLASMSNVQGALSPGELADRLLARAERDLAPNAPGPVLLARLAQARARDARGSTHPAACLAAWEEAVRALTAIGDRRQALLSRTMRGLAKAQMGQPEGVVADLEDVVAEAEHLALPYLAAASHHVLGVVLADLGEHDRAIAHAQAALQEYQRGDVRMDGGTRVVLARALRRAGRLEEAEAEARRAVELLPSVPGILTSARAVLAETLAARGQLDAALVEAIEARRLLDELGLIEWGDVLVRRVHAEVLRSTGQAGEAARAIAETRALLEARATTIPDPGARTAFLHAPPDHAWFFGEP